MREREINGRWLGGERSKVCQHCGITFHWESGQIYTNWKKRKFCSKDCIVGGQKRLYGKDHPRYNPESRKKARGAGKYAKWQQAVFTRDRVTCRHCGAIGIQMHAHHINSWSEFPELRFDVENGLTLCYRCHLIVHSAGHENSVNSVDPLTGGAEGNTEPSLERKLFEGVTTRGRAYRRVEAKCEWCGTFITKPAGRLKYSRHLFCGRSCAGKYSATHRVWRKWINSPMAVNSSTSAGRESEDIV